MFDIFKNNKKITLAYEILMAGLALVVAIILFIEFTRPLTEAQEKLLTNIDLTILIIFAIDYFYRLLRSQNKWIFIKSNIFDLVAIMPFDKAFRLARLARLVRLVRLTRSTRLLRFLRFWRLFRFIGYLKRFGNNFSGVLKTNGLIYVVVITMGIVFAGAIGILAFEDNMQTFGDALWWSLVTTTTVGYGDISPESTGGRVLAGILMIVGIGFLGMVTGSVATYFVDRLSNKKSETSNTVKRDQVEYVKNKLDELDDLNEEEIEALNKIINSILMESQEDK